MNFEQIQNLWTAYDRKIEDSLRINLQVIRELQLHKSQSALRRLWHGVGIELLINLLGVVGLHVFIFEHFRELRFLLPALLLDVVALGLVAFGGYQLAVVRTTDFSIPVLDLQKQLTTLRIRRIRVTQWTALIAPLLWVPLLVVVFKGLLGIDVYAAFDSTWLVVNVAFGVAVIPIGWLICRYGARRFRASAWLNRLMDDVAGRSLVEAILHLNRLMDLAQTKTDLD